MPVTRRLFILSGLAVPLAACTGSYRTDFPAQLSPDLTRSWHVSRVDVAVPQSLTVSEEHALVPHADIVWREDDAAGDRHAQVAAIMHDAISRGAHGLTGPVGVVLNVVVTRFHALSFEAETRLSNAGVHNIQFDISVLGSSGAVLAGPVHIVADFPALSGQEMVDARARGETQKSQIIAHTAQTIAAWLGIGPDNRGSFNRLGD